MTKILLAEDDDALRKMIATILQFEHYDVHAFPNGQVAYDAFENVRPDLVISDISMPMLDGFGLLRAVRQLTSGSSVPFLFLSALSERNDVTEAQRLGADDYLFKPFQPDDLLRAVKLRLERRRAAELFDSHSAHLQTIILLANLIEARDAYTHGHVKRVQTLALEFGQALGWSLEQRLTLEFGALLHDVGKIVIPEAVLNKPGELSSEEMEIMRSHTTAGAHIVRDVPHLKGAIPYILFHHEKWDGTGYPQNLSGDFIPIEGRLMAIVDVYDALTTTRSYHAGISPQEAIDFLRRGAGIHFDPLMVEVFCKLQEGKLQKEKPG